MRRAEKPLNQKRIAGLRKPGTYADRDLPGFLFRILGSGTPIFQVRYTPRGGGVRRTISLGLYGTVTLDEARKRAREILSAVALGADPAAERNRVPTWTSWTADHFKRLTAKSRDTFHARFLGMTPETNPKTGKATDSTFRDLRASWGPRRLDSFTPNDIEEQRQALRAAGKSRTTINRWLAVTAGCFQAAVAAELLGRNPCSKVKADRENPSRSRVLSPDEMGRLLTVLEKEVDRHAATAVLLAVLTGARRGEILSLKWEQLNLEEGFARLPDSKSGRPRFLPLPAQAVEALKALDHLSEYVVASFRKTETTPDGKKKPARPRSDLKRAWERLTKAADLTSATFHDLRRTFGLEVNRAAGLRVAQEALGHSTPDQTAAAYTPEGLAAVKEAAEQRAQLLPFPKKAVG